MGAPTVAVIGPLLMIVRLSKSLTTTVVVATCSLTELLAVTTAVYVLLDG